MTGQAIAVLRMLALNDGAATFAGRLWEEFSDEEGGANARLR